MKEEGRIVDFDLSHYEGDHLLFRHKHLTDEEIHEAYQRVNRIFFSWKNTIRRWVKFLRVQRKNESFAQFLLKLVVTSFVYYKLSIFQRHHAQQKVLQGHGAEPGPRRNSNIHRLQPVYIPHGSPLQEPVQQM